MKTTAILFIVGMSASLSAYDQTRKATLSSSGIKTIHIEAEAGSLEIKQGGEEIRVEARIVVEGRTSEEEEEYVRNYLDLSLQKDGDRAVLRSGFKERSSWFDHTNKRIDLIVWVPKDKPLRVEDGSGSTYIADLQNDLYVSDGSGDLDIKNIKGHIVIEDGSGSIRLSDIVGNVHIDDGSGEIDVRSVDGNVEVNDGSGSIRLVDIKRDVTIYDDGSGGVSISNVQGNVIRHDKHRDWDD